jgi:hypothetical protein
MMDEVKRVRATKIERQFGGDQMDRRDKELEAYAGMGL